MTKAITRRRARPARAPACCASGDKPEKTMTSCASEESLVVKGTREQLDRGPQAASS
jgi:hypothetical protein